MFFKQGFGQWRSANVAKANKHNLELHLRNISYAQSHPAHFCSDFSFGVAFASRSAASTHSENNQ
jgi:hypothetical protein